MLYEEAVKFSGRKENQTKEYAVLDGFVRY